MPSSVSLKSRPQPPSGHITRLIPQEGYSFIETSAGKDRFSDNERLIDPGFDRLDIDAPANCVEAGAATRLQARHATAARHARYHASSVDP
jgi:hypothetical protein